MNKINIAEELPWVIDKDEYFFNIYKKFIKNKKNLIIIGKMKKIRKRNKQKEKNLKQCKKQKFYKILYKDNMCMKCRDEKFAKKSEYIINFSKLLF